MHDLDHPLRGDPHPLGKARAEPGAESGADCRPGPGSHAGSHLGPDLESDLGRPARRRPGRRLWLTAAGLASGLALGTIRTPAPRIVWNTTASAPLGFYRLGRSRRLARGDWVAVKPSPALAAWLDRCGFLPERAYLLKRIAATAGETVCRDGARLLIEGRFAARAHRLDRWGRRLPQWRGCIRLSSDQVFLLNPAPGSLDGRYLGPTPAREVAGLARPLWTWGPVR